jgi:hypothetical protein
MGTSMTAMLAPEDVGGRPDGVTATIPRGDIEEALASDAPLDLFLDVTRTTDGRVENSDVKVTWQREDLESLLDRFESEAITLAFDPAELERALDDDFEAHGIREMVLLTVAAASASAALAASTASGQPLEAASGGPVAAVVAPGHGEALTASELAAAATVGTGDATTARDLAAQAAIHDEAGSTARGVEQIVPGADEATPAQRGIDVPIATAVEAREATTARDLAAPAAIHDEAGSTARGVDQIVPGADEATLTARGIDTPAVHDEATLVGRGIEEAVVVDSGSSFELPAVDSGTAAAIGGLAGATLIIGAAAFAARRQRVGPA